MPNPDPTLLAVHEVCTPQQMAYCSAFSHDNEVAQPGYYSVLLERYHSLCVRFISLFLY